MKILKRERIAKRVDLTITKSFLSDEQLDEKVLTSGQRNRYGLSIVDSEMLRNQLQDAKDNHFDDELTLSNYDVLNILTLSDPDSGSPDRDAQQMLHSNLLKPLLGDLAYKNFTSDVSLAGLSYIVVDGFKVSGLSNNTLIYFTVEYDPEQLDLNAVMDAVDQVVDSNTFQYGDFSTQLMVPLAYMSDDSREKLLTNDNIMFSDYTPKALQLEDDYGSPFEEFGVSDDEAVSFARLPEHVDIQITF